MRDECATREPERAWILLEVVGDSRSSEREHCVFYLIKKKMTTTVQHKYYKMIRTREARMKTFMQLEIEACLEEVNWMIRCHNCEALNCPQEKHPARLLPTPPPSYIDNLQSRLITVRKGICPASLKMIMKTKYPLPERRLAPETSVQPDDVIGEHRAGENNPSSQGDLSPRRAAVDTGSEEPGTPPRLPAIGTGSGPGVSQPETQIMEEGDIFPFETSMDGFLRSNCTSTEQEYILLHQSDIGVDDNDEATASRVQAGAREESARLPIGQQQGMTAWPTDQNRQFDRGRSRVTHLFF